MTDTNALKPCPLDLVTLLRRFAEVYATQKGLPWIGTVRPEQAFARAADALEARPEQQNTDINAVERVWRKAHPTASDAMIESLRELARRQRQYGADNSERIDRTCDLTVGDLDKAADALEAALLNPEGKP